MNDIGIFDSQIKRHTPSRSNSITLNLLLRDPSQPLPMIHHQHRQQRNHTRTQRVPHKHHPILRTVLQPQPLQRLRFPVQQPNRRFQQPVMNVASIEHLLPELVIHEELVVTLLRQVEAAHGQHDLAVVVVGVDEVGRRVALGVLVGGAFDDPVGVEVVAGGGGLGVGWVVEVGFVDGEDEAAEAGDGFELVGGGGGPGGAVVGAYVGATFPEPACAA